MIPLVMIGVWGWKNLNTSEYSLNELVSKYPSLSELKKAVDSGELDYNKLPKEAKKFLDEYQEIKEITPDNSNYIEMEK